VRTLSVGPLVSPQIDPRQDMLQRNVHPFRPAKNYGELSLPPNITETPTRPSIMNAYETVEYDSCDVDNHNCLRQS
jgi:hypothetical protein